MIKDYEQAAGRSQYTFYRLFFLLLYTPYQAKVLTVGKDES